MILHSWTVNRFGNCGSTFLHDTRRPLQDNGSAGDQTEYRAALDAYFATQDTPRSLPVAPPYVPPAHPNCTRWCRNGYHPESCPEANHG